MNPSKTNKPLVSVIINCYNGEKYLKEAIDSVYAQTYDCWEIIFWDNASSDSSELIAKSYDCRLRYYRGDENIPLYAARNKALSHCLGDFIAFIDSDDIWLPEKLEKQIPLFSNPAISLVYGDSYVFNEQGIIRQNLKHRVAYFGDSFVDLLKNYMLHILTVVIRRSIIDRYDLSFNDTLNIVGDAEFFLKVAYYSQLAYTPDVVAKWRLHNESLSQTKKLDLLNELDLMYDQLDIDLPLMSTKYKNDSLLARSNLCISKAIYYWRLRDKKMMRQWLKVAPVFRLKNIILYCFSFFNYHFIAKLTNR